MGFKIETISEEGMPRDLEQWTCETCGWTETIEAGGDVACCPECERRTVEEEAMMEKAEEEHPCPEICPFPDRECKDCHFGQYQLAFVAGMKATYKEADEAKTRRDEYDKRHMVEETVNCANCGRQTLRKKAYLIKPEGKDRLVCGDCYDDIGTPEVPDTPSLEDQGYQRPRSDY